MMFAAKRERFGEMRVEVSAAMEVRFTRRSVVSGDESPVRVGGRQ